MQTVVLVHKIVSINVKANAPNYSALSTFFHCDHLIIRVFSDIWKRNTIRQEMLKINYPLKGNMTFGPSPNGAHARKHI